MISICKCCLILRLANMGGDKDVRVDDEFIIVDPTFCDADEHPKDRD